MKALIVEIPYSSFLKVIGSAPERISELEVSSTSFSYLLDGRAAVTRTVPLAPAMVDRYDTYTTLIY